MNDKDIVKLFLERSEDALLEIQKKYSRYANYIAHNILYNREDSEECVNQAYLKVWESIPPHRPENLSAYLGKIVRNLALDMYEKHNAKKRGAGQVSLAYEELKNYIDGTPQMDTLVDDMHFKEILNQFLWSLPKETRQIFIRRYWYLSPVKEISSDFQLSESKVKMTLLRTRKKLKEYLEQEGISL